MQRVPFELEVKTTLLRGRNLYSRLSMKIYGYTSQLIIRHICHLPQTTNTMQLCSQKLGQMGRNHQLFLTLLNIMVLNPPNGPLGPVFWEARSDEGSLHRSEKRAPFFLKQHLV